MVLVGAVLVLVGVDLQGLSFRVSGAVKVLGWFLLGLGWFLLGLNGRGCLLGVFGALKVLGWFLLGLGWFLLGLTGRASPVLLASCVRFGCLGSSSSISSIR